VAAVNNINFFTRVQTTINDNNDTHGKFANCARRY